MYKRLLTIQDVSCVGQCSLTVALPVISACGVETAILPAAVLSTHTGGFKHYTFCDLTPEIARIEESWKKEGIRFDAFYTGYVCPEQIDPILGLFESCAAPGAVRVIDPVMADHGVLYPGFGPDFPAQMARLCRSADYVLPNLTEAAFLLGREPVLSGYDPGFIEQLVRDLADVLGARNVVLTGVSFDPAQLGLAIFDGETVRYDFNPRIERMSHGTGDLFASVFAGALLRGWTAFDAAALAADIVCSAINATPEEHWYGVAFEKVLPELVERLSR
ncbi:MAG: bifunctional hydroxymethylpyrimidine kinase/phosphomethylpyrimidine kinase [Kiritimatiellia bacterium]|jgi:pyridoxine kinase